MSPSSLTCYFQITAPVHIGIAPFLDLHIDNILRRQLESIVYRTPEDLLQDILPEVEMLFRSNEIPGELKGQRKQVLEQYHAGLVGWMVKKMGGQFAEVSVALGEQCNYDCIIKAGMEGQTVFRTVQLKEVPPEELSPSASFQGIIANLRKYGHSPELIVSIWINRNVSFTLSDIDVSGLKIGSLIFVGDRGDGAVELHGGTLEDWESGIVWEGIMQHGKLTIHQTRFRPYHQNDGKSM